MSRQRNAAALDLYLLPVARLAGVEDESLLSLHASEPPRRPARGRERDRLILYLSIQGNAPLSATKQAQILANLAHLYYQTPGSVTTALRTVADELNRLLWERNTALAGSNRQGLGVLTQLALRGNQVTLAIGGAAHAYHLTSERVSLLADPELGERALGQSRQTPLRLFQLTLRSGDILLLHSGIPKSGQLPLLANLHGLGPESLRRKLFPPSLNEANAVIVAVRAGEGRIHLPHSKDSALPPPSPRKRSVFLPRWLPFIRKYQAKAAEGTMPGAPAAERERIFLPLEESATDLAISPSAEPSAAGPPPSSPPPPTEQKPPAKTRRFFAALKWAGTIVGRLLQPLGRFLARLLPADSLAGLSSATMAFFALAIPLFIVTVASAVYMRWGRQAQFELYFSQAQQLAARGLEQSAASARYADLQAALDLLQRAERYGSDAQIPPLRERLLSALDELELSQRLTYQPALLGGLPSQVQITAILPLQDELYLMDGVNSRLFYARRTTRGYEIVANFECGSGANAPPGLETLVDFAPWPPGFDPKASLIAIDAGGVVLFCGPQGLLASKRLTPPEGVESWGPLTFLALDLGATAVYEDSADQVWVYRRNAYDQPPTPFFEEAKRPQLVEVIDFGVHRGEYYFLHSDGTLTLCSASGCSRPPYVDLRPGRENLPLVPPHPFAALQITPPPDPSLFLLEKFNRAIYHFSLRTLLFQRQYTAANGLPGGEATAFAVDNLRRYVFIAVGNSLYYATYP